LQKNAAHGFEFREIAGTCHYPMIEHPEAFNEALNDTINAIRA
jgi:pimeloyl-ACP methyl ester carboxylesterase